MAQIPDSHVDVPLDSSRLDADKPPPPPLPALLSSPLDSAADSPQPLSSSSSSFRPSRPPLVTANLQHRPADAPGDQATTSDSLPSATESTTSHDPDGFYLRYRDPARGREPAGLYALSNSTSSPPTSAPMASVLPPRASHFDRKPGPPPSSMTVRLGNLAGKAGQDGAAGAKREPAMLPRGRQASVKAFVSQFEQRADEVISLPGSKPGSRSTSANNSPGTTFNSRSFRSRTPSRAADERMAYRRKSGTEKVPGLPEAPLPLNIQKKSARRGSTEQWSAFSSNKDAAAVCQLSENAAGAPSKHGQASVAQQQQQPLFGEIVAGQADFGWGIPAARQRSGSTDGIVRPESLFRDDTALHISPTSPSSWYRQPTFDGFDSTRLPPQAGEPTLRRQRSKSDLSGAGSAMQKSIPSNDVSKQPSSSSIPPGSRQSKLPLLSRRISYANDSEAAKSSGSFTEHLSREGYSTSSRQASTLPSSEDVSNTRLHHHHQHHQSPRRAVLSINTGSSPQLGAQITPISPSAKSPPLRNSRNRPSLATASTASSRSKMVERSKTVGSGASPTRKHGRQNLPELGTVDFAARRERIQRAFSKSVEEKEAEQRRSLILDAQRRKNEVPPVPTIDSRHFDAQKEFPPEVGHPRKDSETLAPAATPESLDDPSVDISANFAPPPPVLRRGSADDSPTLGSLGYFPGSRQHVSTPSDEGSAESNANFFDQHQAFEDNLAPDEKGASAELSAHPQPESIHIVLGESQLGSGQARVPRAGADASAESRWSMSSWASSTDSTYRYSATGTGDARLESINEVHDVTEQSKSGNEAEVDKPAVVQEPSTEAAKLDSPTLREPARSSQWMVDQSIVPPRSFAQDTGPNAGSGRNSPTVSRKSLPASNVAPTGLRRPESHQPEKQILSPTARVSSLSPHLSLDHHANKYLQRASLINPADFVDASPSIGDWIAVQAQDTPTDETSPYSFSDRDEILQTKKVTGLRPRSPKKTDGLLLPEIQTTEGGLGIEIGVDGPREYIDAKPPPETPEQTLQAKMTDMHVPEPLQPLPSPSHLSSSPSRGTASKHSSMLPSSDGPTLSVVEGPASRPRSTRSQTTMNSDDNKASSIDTRTLASEQSVPIAPKQLSEEEQKARDAEVKRLNRRKNIIKELVDTESSFGQDMTVVVDIYKETSHVILANPDDVKVLFGNAAEIVQFSTNFLDALKASVSSVYKLPRSKRWRTKRDSSATAESSLADETSSISNLELTDDERDRLTSIGAVFDQHLEQMEKIYTDYLKNHEQANSKLAELMKSDKVQIWLNECRAYAHDLTTAWSLDSLLVKPVQRILKYPLLLKELADVTPDNHPDFVALDSMCREIVGVSKRINAAKKRADLVEQAHTGKKEKRKKDDRSGFAKAFGRNKEKLKQQVGLSEIVQDKAYNMLADKFGSHFFQVQVVMRDIEMYTVDVQSSVKRFESFVSAIEEHMDVAQSPYPEIESKWRMFRQAARELQLTALTDHVNNVRDHVIQPMKTLLKYYEGPQRMMEKRKKRLIDHARWKQTQDVGGRVDKKLIEQGEQFVAINETLKEELPQLFTKTKQLVEHCLNIFVQLQLQWQTIWRRKLSQAIDARHLPKDVKDIIECFNGDFKYTEAQVLSLAICNGALKDDDSIQLNHSSTGLSSSSTTLNGDESSSRQTSITFDDIRDPRHSGQGRTRAASGTGQPAYQTAAYYPAAYAQGPSSRDRASSSTSGRRSEQYQRTGQGHLSVASPQSATSSGRPSSQSARGNSAPYGQNPYDPSSYSRYSDDSTRSSHWYSGFSYSRYRDSTNRPNDTQYGLGAALAGAAGAAGAAANPRGSAIFSSALPPSDTTPPSSASLSQQSQQQQPQSASSQSRFDPGANHGRFNHQPEPQFNVLFLAASVYEFNIDRARREAGYPYLTYSAGEIFDVIGEKGELWLAKNQDDPTNTLGWIWNKHFAKLASEH